MRASILSSALVAICVSACSSTGQYATQSAANPYRVTKADITVRGGTCAGNLCTDPGGLIWDCSGGGPCYRVDQR